MHVTPHNLIERVCVYCDEINLLERDEDVTKRKCDDCHKIGGLMTFQQYDALTPADKATLRKEAGRIR